MSAPKDILAQLLSAAQADLLDSAGREAWRSASGALSVFSGSEPAISDVDGRLVMPDEIEAEFAEPHLVVPIRLTTNKDQSASGYLIVGTAGAAAFFETTADDAAAQEQSTIVMAGAALSQVMQALTAMVSGSPVALTLATEDVRANSMPEILKGMDEPALCLTATMGGDRQLPFTLVLPGTFLDILAGALPEQLTTAAAPRAAAPTAPTPPPAARESDLPFELTLEEIESSELLDELPPVVRTGAFGARVDSPFGANPFVGIPAGVGGREPTPIGAGMASAASTAHRAQFAPLADVAPSGTRAGMDLLAGLKMNVSVELGRTELTVADVLGLGPGAVIELDRLAGEPVDILVNDTLIARGEVVVVDENFGVRVVEVLRRGVEAEERTG